MMNRSQSIRATFEIFKENSDSVIEVRAMDQYTWSGYFKSRENLIRELAKNDEKTWYFVMNDINPACFSREQNEKILSKRGLKTTSDTDIERLTWLLVDVDPKRPAGVSSTDAEKDSAYSVIKQIYSYLRNIGFSSPVVCDSGNGYHLLYKTDLSTSNSEYIKRFLQALDMMFSSDLVDVDTTVFNPARITKVYGTIARKGSNTKDRPHRASGIVWVPDEVKPTSIQLIKKVADVLPVSEQPSYRNNYTDAKKFDVDEFIRATGIKVSKDYRSGEYRRIVLEECPFNPNHKAPDSMIAIHNDGKIGFKCFHNSCMNKRWQDVRKLFDPHCYDRQQEQPRSTSPEVTKRPSISNSTLQTENHFLRLCDIVQLDRSSIVSIPTGFELLDKKLIGMNKGELSIWSGGNGSGKSTLLSQLALESIDRGFKVAMFSGELTSTRMKYWLHLQAAGRQNTKQGKDGVSWYVPKAESRAIDAWAADKLWVYNNDYGIKVNSVLQDFESHIQKHQTDVVIIDNLMSLDLSSMQGEKYDKQTRLVLELSELSKRHNVHVHFVCHPRKPLGFLRKADISGTADLTNAADNVFMVHRVNPDFIRMGGEFFGKSKISEFAEFNNVVEVMKNRDMGVADELFGLYFEPESKRMLNERFENKVFGWQEDFEIADWM